MGRRTTTSMLSLKLDVIVEEDSVNSIDHLTIPNVNPSNNNTAYQNNPTCTITLRNTSRSNTSEPQFLHTGEWPCMDMVEDTIDHKFDSLDHTIDTVTIFVPSDKPMVKNIATDDNTTDTWGIVTTDQLSMVMDYWDPNRNANPLSSVTTEPTIITNALSKPSCQSLHAVQHSLFLREIMDEHLTRMSTVEHIDELEDNDSAIEIVAILEGYRQNGWADEMIKAFPKECWLFWSNSGLHTTENVEHDHVCEDEYGLFRH